MEVFHDESMSFANSPCRDSTYSTYVFSARVAVLCIKGLEAVAAVGPSVLHDVALAAEGGLALVAAEVLHVPVPALRLGAFISKDYLRGQNMSFISKDIQHRD